MTPLEWLQAVNMPPDLLGTAYVIARNAGLDGWTVIHKTTLAEQLAVTPSTVNRALRHLVNLGVLERRTGKGGPGAPQILRLRTELQPERVSALARLQPHHAKNSGRKAAAVDGHVVQPAAFSLRRDLLAASGIANARS